MIIRWLDDAVYDLQAVRQYIAVDKPNAANHVAKRIISAVNLLSEQPEIGRPGSVYGTRELVISGTPYIVPYQFKNNAIEILRVFHSAMRWSEELGA